MILLAFVVAVLPYTLQTTATIISIDHEASSIPLVVLKLALIAIAIGIHVDASPAELSVLPLSLIAISVGICHVTLPVLLSS